MRQCSLVRQVELVQSDLRAWRALSMYHYRPGSPGAVSKVFAWQVVERSLPGRRKQGQGRFTALGWRCTPVGVIVYVMPTLNSRMRNALTGGRYNTSNAPERIASLNRDFRRIARVVIHPAWRGVGLGRELVRQTLPLAGTRYVEAAAAMGAVHPFLEQADMTRYDLPDDPRRVKLLNELGQVGVKCEDCTSPTRLTERLEGLAAGEQQALLQRIRGYLTRYGKHGRKIADDPAKMMAYLTRHLTVRPVYYLWQRKYET